MPGWIDRKVILSAIDNSPMGPHPCWWVYRAGETPFHNENFVCEEMLDGITEKIKRLKDICKQ